MCFCKTRTSTHRVVHILNMFFTMMLRMFFHGFLLSFSQLRNIYSFNFHFFGFQPRFISAYAFLDIVDFFLDLEVPACCLLCIFPTKLFFPEPCGIISPYHILQDQYLADVLSVAVSHLCLALNDFLASGLSLRISMFGSPNITFFT